MIPTTETILVTGATGQQGGATARHLLEDGFRVRALVRDSEGLVLGDAARPRRSSRRRGRSSNSQTRHAW